MKNALVEREVITSPPLSRRSMALSTEHGDLAFLFHILRNSLYGDKELAVLREYGTNAWDEHRQAGIPDVPIKVDLPTILDPTLRIRDYGRALNEEDFYTIFLTYLRSLKRDTDLAAGFMGLGSKSGFAYTDSFMVTCHHKGVRSVYSVVLDASNVGEGIKLDEGPTNETGIEIAIPIRTDDIPKFTRTAEWLFRWFRPLPVITGVELEAPRFQWEGKHGAMFSFAGYRGKDGGWVSYDPGEWVARMGCVPYEIDLDQLAPADPDDLKPGDLDPEDMSFLRYRSGALFFEIGDLRVSASRESLEYTPEIIAKLRDKVRDLLDEWSQRFRAQLEDTQIPLWKRYRMALETADTKGLRLPPDLKARYAKSKVRLFKQTETKDGEVVTLGEARPTTFTMKRPAYYKRDDNAFRCLESTWDVDMTSPGFLIRDNKRALRDYLSGADNNWMVLEPARDTTAEAVEVEVREFLARLGLEDIPVGRFTDSDPPKREKSREEKREEREALRWNNPKHKVNCFVLDEGRLGTSPPLSDNWEIVDRVPQEDDVFIVINRFEASGYGYRTGAVYRKIAEVRKLWAFLGEEFPTIYGYKTTMKKPVDAESLTGTEFMEWYGAALPEVLARKPEIKALADAWAWSVLVSNTNIKNVTNVHEFFQDNLDGRHTLCRTFTKIQDGRRHLRVHMPANKDKDKEVRKILERISKLLGSRGAPQRALARIYKRYPHLHPDVDGPGLGAFDGTRSFYREPEKAKKLQATWIQYIRLMDGKTS